ncbi:MAG TPA: ribonuclease H-like domain-containing protein [Kiritimatiellia bacterium]|nr:ribonuclease H-like domain-containing protein [Kiritimatiellia bacterium]
MNNPSTPGALLHLPGIGPRKLLTLHQRGLLDWFQLRASHPPQLPGLPPDPFLHALEQSIHAFTQHNLHHLVQTLKPQDHWRILHDFGHEATYLDIETTGDDLDPSITVVACLHRGTLHTFVQNENLDDLLDLLDDIRLLVTFNGTGFDLPAIEDHFRIPPLHLPHLDLRWICYHHRLRGGLKAIEKNLGITRPSDLTGTDGAEAVWLWRQWTTTRNPASRLKLIRYCSADVITLHLLRHQLLATHNIVLPETDPQTLWDQLPSLPETPLPPHLSNLSPSLSREQRYRSLLRS